MKRVGFVFVLVACWILLPLGAARAEQAEKAEWTVYPITDSTRRPEDKPRDQWVDSIAVAGDSTVWVTTRFDGMAYLDRNGWHTLHDVSESLIGPDLFFFCCFTAARDGTVWMHFLCRSWADSTIKHGLSM